MVANTGITMLSDRPLRWLEHFSLYDFKQEYIPGDDNVLPDTLSRPATQVLSISASGHSEEWDLWTLAVRLDDSQAIIPVMPSLVAVLSDTLFQTDHPGDPCSARKRP